MARQKKFKERIHDLRLQYGTTKKLADSLNVSERTVYRWLKREEKPKGFESRMKRKTGNPEPIKRREKYFFRDKPKKEYKRRSQIEPFEVQKGELLERPVMIFDSLELTDTITALTKSNRFSKGKIYEITVQIQQYETLEKWDMVRKVKGYQIKSQDQIESLAWQFLRDAYLASDDGNLGIFIMGIKEI